MQKKYERLKEVEELLKSIYGEKSSHIAYLNIYKKLLACSSGEEKEQFYYLLDLYINKTENIEEAFAVTKTINLIIKHVPWFNKSYSALIRYIEENKCVSLACEIIEFVEEDEQKRLIDLVAKDNANLLFYISKNLFLSTEIYVSRKLMEKDMIDELIEFTTSFEVNAQQVVDYITKQIKTEKFSGNLKNLNDLFSLTENVDFDNLKNAIEEKYSADEIYNYLKMSKQQVAFIFLKILIDKKPKYLMDLVASHNSLVKFTAETVDYIIKTKNTKLMLLFYDNFVSIKWSRSQSYLNNKRKLFEAIMSSKNDECICALINRRFNNEYENELVENYLIETKSIDEILYRFLNEKSSDKLKLYISIIRMDQIDKLHNELKKLEKDKLYEIFNLMIFISTQLKENSGELENLIIYKLSMETLNFIKKEAFALQESGEDIDVVAISLDDEFKKYNELEKSDTIVQRIRKKFKSQNQEN